MKYGWVMYTTNTKYAPSFVADNLAQHLIKCSGRLSDKKHTFIDYKEDIPLHRKKDYLNALDIFNLANGTSFQ